MARVIISAGHTSIDKGARGEGIYEHEITRKIADYTVAALREKGVITLSVPLEIDLRSRIEWINNTGYSDKQGDICLEIHVNDGGKTGIEGWYKDKGENESFKLTKTIVDTLCEDMSFDYQGVKSEYEHELKQLAFVHYSKPVPALVECLYIDNPDDLKILQDDVKLEEIGKSIANGISKYLKTSTLKKEEEDKKALEDQKKDSVATDIKPAPVVTPDSLDDSYKDDFGLDSMGQSPSPVNPAQPANLGVSGFSNMQPQYPTTPIGGISFEEREKRRLFIEDLYSKALGRKPSFQDSTYLINNWTNEKDLVLMMLDSQDHADILAKAIDYDKSLEEVKDKDNTISRLKIEIRDKDGIIENINKLVVEKNSIIDQLRRDQKASSYRVDYDQSDGYSRKESIFTRLAEFIRGLFPS